MLKPETPRALLQGAHVIGPAKHSRTARHAAASLNSCVSSSNQQAPQTALLQRCSDTPAWCAHNHHRTVRLAVATWRPQHSQYHHNSPTLPCALPVGRLYLSIMHTGRTPKEWKLTAVRQGRPCVHCALRGRPNNTVRGVILRDPAACSFFLRVCRAAAQTQTCWVQAGVR